MRLAERGERRAMGVPSLAFRADEPRVGAHRVGEALRAAFLGARELGAERRPKVGW